MRTKHASQGRLLPSTPGVIDCELEPITSSHIPAGKLLAGEAVVDVALVPAGDHERSQVGTTLIPARPHVSFPKPRTKLERAIANKAKRLLDAKRLRQWALDVKTRDHWKDQKTGQRVHSSRSLDPLRAEAHHIEPKATRAVRYDIRNGVTLSLATHLAVEAGVYRIEGTVFFLKDGQHFIDGTFPVIFVRL